MRKNEKPMKNSKSNRMSLILAIITLSTGCASTSFRAKVTYWDRNGDGKVDIEKHQYKNLADADSELRDDDYDGRYEKKVLFGVGVFESKVDLLVPTNVRMKRSR